MLGHGPLGSAPLGALPLRDTQKLSLNLRFPSEQADAIARANKLREEAISLRSAASRGSYTDAELERFWLLVTSAGSVLMASNPELSERAGLGRGYFSQAGGRPKLRSFMCALTAIIEVANDRLIDVDGVRKVPGASATASGENSTSQVVRNPTELIILARSLSTIARQEIDKLTTLRPNSPEAKVAAGKQIELLETFASGFEEIAIALQRLSASPDDKILLGNARAIVLAIGANFSDWWTRNGNEAVDWAYRIPVFAGGVALLSMAGANMTAATTAIGAMVIGPKAAATIRQTATKSKTVGRKSQSK